MTGNTTGGVTSVLCKMLHTVYHHLILTIYEAVSDYFCISLPKHKKASVIWPEVAAWLTLRHVMKYARK